MRIVTQIAKQTEFGCLTNGEVFNDIDGCTYMKIPPVKGGVGNSANAVSLSTGIVEYFYVNEKVIRLDCELIITGYKE